MSFKEYPNIGKVWMPERTISLRAKPMQREHWGVVVASQTRLRGVDEIRPLVPEIEHPYEGQAAEELAKWHGEFAPEKFERETIWASVTHNERVDMGASITINRLFGTVGTAANGVFTAIALGGTGGAAPSFAAVITKTKTDLSLGVITASATTNEATTNGLARAAGTVQNLGAAPGALDGNQSVDITKTFAVTGNGAIFAAGLFDQVVVASSHLYCEDNFASSATVVNTDSLVVTWTCSQ